MGTKRAAHRRPVFRAPRVRSRPASASSGSSSASRTLASHSSLPSSSSSSSTSAARTPSLVVKNPPRAPAPLPSRPGWAEGLPRPSSTHHDAMPPPAAVGLVVIDLSSDNEEEMDWEASSSEDSID